MSLSLLSPFHKCFWSRLWGARIFQRKRNFFKRNLLFPCLKASPSGGENYTKEKFWKVNRPSSAASRPWAVRLKGPGSPSCPQFSSCCQMILPLCNAQIREVMALGSDSPSLWVGSTPGTPLLILSPLLFVFLHDSTYVCLRRVMHLLKRRNNFLRINSWKCQTKGPQKVMLCNWNILTSHHEDVE